MIAYVQKPATFAGTNSGVANVVLTNGSQAVAVGNYMVLMWGAADPNYNPSGIVDSAGNTWHQAEFSGAEGFWSCGIWYAKVETELPANTGTITVTFQATWHDKVVAVMEFSGIHATAPLSDTAVKNGTWSASPTNPVAGTCSQGLAVTALVTSGNQAYTVAGGFTDQDTVVSAGYQLEPLWRLAGRATFDSAGTFASAQNYRSASAVFKAAPGVTLDVGQLAAGPASSSGSAVALTALTTGSAVASGATIWCFWTGYDAMNLDSVSDNGAGGSLAWKVDMRCSVLSAGAHYTVWAARAYAPAGLASGTVITPATSGGTYGGLTRDPLGVAFSFNGVSASGRDPYDQPIQNPPEQGTGTWSKTGITSAPGGLLVGLAFSQGSGGDPYPSTPDAGTTEIVDYSYRADDTNYVGATAVYRIEANAGSYALGAHFNYALNAVEPLWFSCFAEGQSWAGGSDSPATLAPARRSARSLT